MAQVEALPAGASHIVCGRPITAASDPRAAEVVKLCFFVGLTQEQAARELSVSAATVERDWAFARVWLFREIRRSQNPVI